MNEGIKTPVIAETIRRLLDRWAFGEYLDPRLEFPQNIGGNRIAAAPTLPIGLLKILWGWGNSWFKHPCTQCGSTSYVVAFGGYISWSSLYYTCIGCNITTIESGPHGAGSIGDILRESPYPYSKYKLNWIFRRQEKIPDDGAALLKALGIEGTPESFRDYQTALQERDQQSPEKGGESSG